jgi:hypothetical protein
MSHGLYEIVSNLMNGRDAVRFMGRSVPVR